jgi:hypothetical protein
MGRDRETIVIERKCGSSRGIHPAVAWQPSTGRCGQWPSSPDVPNRNGMRIGLQRKKGL